MFPIHLSKICLVCLFYYLFVTCAFQVTICSSPDDYEVFFNGEKAHTYSHRFTKLEEIDVLEVSGDVQLSFVQP